MLASEAKENALRTFQKSQLIMNILTEIDIRSRTGNFQCVYNLPQGIEELTVRDREYITKLGYIISYSKVVKSYLILW